MTETIGRWPSSGLYFDGFLRPLLSCRTGQLRAFEYQPGSSAFRAHSTVTCLDSRGNLFPLPWRFAKRFAFLVAMESAHDRHRWSTRRAGPISENRGSVVAKVSTPPATHRFSSRDSRSAVDAVEGAVVALEDDPEFNAGCGSVLNTNGEVEMDASIMDGKDLSTGAVSAVRGIANPIKLARLVMEKTPHCFLTHHGAAQFAAAMGVPEIPAEKLITERNKKRLEKEKHEKDAQKTDCQK
nr:isoaspartyl peptidase/L-asparaginase-like [Aotus nancymaae]